MREQSYKDVNNSQPNRIRGGETKVMRKLLNAFLVFALVLTMVTPAFAANASQTPDAKFQELKSAGIMSGYADGTAGLDKTMTRAELAKVLVNTFELAPVTGKVDLFKDEPQDHWAYTEGYIGAAVNAGLMEGGLKADGTYGFRPNDQVSLQELAVVLVRALDLPKDVNATVDGKTAVWATSSVAAALKAGLLNASTDYTVSASRADLVVGIYATYEAQQAEKVPQVVSVSAINAKQVVVNFNSPMDATTLIDSVYGNVKNVVFAATTTASDAVDSSTATAALSADGKALTITLASGTFEGTYSITVDKDALTTEGKAIVDYAGTFSIVDRVAPELVSVKAVTNTNVATSASVKFSEPVSAAVVKIDGVAYSPASGLNTTTLTFTGLALDATKTHTVEVLNATDAKSNIKALQSTTFVVTRDTVAPTVQASVVGDHQIKLTFSKDMDVSTVSTSSVKVVEEDFTALVANSQYTVAPIGTSQKEFLVTVIKPLYATKTARTLTVQVNNTAKDYLGNAGVVTTQSVNLTKDVVAPTLLSTEVVKDANGNAAKLRFVFSEGLSAAPANLSALSAKNAVTGVDETVTSLLDATTITLLSDGKTVQVDVYSYAVGKKINFVGTTGFVQDLAQTANNSAAFSKVVDFPSAAGTFAIAQTDLNVATQNTIQINFGQPVVGDFGVNAANNPANYTIAGKALPADTSITIASDRTNVTIVLPAEFVATTDANALFTVNNIKSLAGATITPFVGYANVKDNVTPKLTNVVMNANGSVTLDFDEDITVASSVYTEAGVQVTLNNGAFSVPSAKYVFSAGSGADAGNIVMTFVTLTDATYGTYIDLNSDGSYTAGTDILVADIVNVNVKTLAGNGIKDAEGNEAKDNITVGYNK